MPDDKLKVLHLNGGNLYGGIETALGALARLQFGHPGLEFEFALCFPGRHYEELVASGSIVHDLSPVRLSRPWTVWRARRRLRHILLHSPPDFAITHGSWVHSIAAPVIRKRRLPLATWVHGTLNRSGRLDRLAAGSQPDLVIANSRHTLNAARSVFPHQRAEVLCFPIEPSCSDARDTDRCRLRAEFGIDDDTCVVLMVSRMEAWKGHRVLLEAVKKLETNRKFVVLIVGASQRPEEEVYLAELKAFAAESNLQGRVRFLGQRSDVRSLMFAADIFCQPNTSPEPFGIVFIEALYAGLPVITSNIGGGAEIVDASCGRLVEPGASQALSIELGHLIECDSLRSELASRGPARADSLCNPGRQMNQLEALLRSVVASR